MFADKPELAPESMNCTSGLNCSEMEIIARASQTSSLYSTAVCGGLIVILLFLWTKSMFSSRKVRHLEGKKLLPIPKIPIFELVTRFLLMRQKFGDALVMFGKRTPVMVFDVLNMRVVSINDFKLAKECMSKASFSGKPGTDQGMWSYLSQGKYGIFSTDGQYWDEQRKFCIHNLKNFGFGSKKMETFIYTEIDDFVNIVTKAKGVAFSPNKKFYTPSLNSLWMILAGKRYSEESERIVGLTEKLYECLSLVLSIPEIFIVTSQLSSTVLELLVNYLPFFPGLKRGRAILFELREYFSEVVAERKKIVNMTDAPADLLDSYIQKMNTVNEEKKTTSGFYGNEGEMNLLGVMVDFFLAGGDTTANTLTWAMIHLIRNPDIQRKLQRELDEHIGKDRRPVIADRKLCPYVEAFLWETLRCNPVVIAAVPHTTTEDTNIGPYFIEKNTTVFLNIIKIHRDPSLWEDPEVFRPERFLTPDGKVFLKHEHMVAFSIGKRKCPGELLARDNLFLFLSSLCQRFTFQKDPNSKDYPSLEPQFSSGMHVPKKFSMLVHDRWDPNCPCCTKSPTTTTPTTTSSSNNIVEIPNQNVSLQA